MNLYYRRVAIVEPLCAQAIHHGVHFYIQKYYVRPTIQISTAHWQSPQHVILQTH